VSKSLSPCHFSYKRHPRCQNFSQQLLQREPHENVERIDRKSPPMTVCPARCWLVRLSMAALLDGNFEFIAVAA
jgi:hypothetical protein